MPNTLPMSTQSRLMPSLAGAGPRASIRLRLGLMMMGFAFASAGVLVVLLLYLRSEAIAVGEKLGNNLAVTTHPLRRCDSGVAG